ncbi:MAG: ABC transporter permease [Pseudomonadota bacterium]
MGHLFPLAWKSAWNRRYSLGLTVLAIALSVTLLLGIERLRQDARAGFEQSISGTDLVVGARSSPVQLMLYSVFRMGEATQNMGWQSARELAAHPAVAWSIPLSLGDSHQGYPVVGTSQDYFRHFHYGEGLALAFAQGQPFAGLWDAVLGAEVARGLGYKLGDPITLSHGLGGEGMAEHGDKPFRVVGILAPTGTPVDRSVHIQLESLEAIHLDWQGGAPLPGLNIPPDLVKKFDLTPKSITALLVGLHSRARVFAMQRQIAAYPDEALMAVLPGVALSQLWDVVGVVEKALLAISALVVAVGLAGLVAVVLSGLDQRRRELAILRANGARPRDIFLLLALEGGLLTLAGLVLGISLLAGLVFFLAPWVQAHYGLVLGHTPPGLAELRLLGWVLGVGLAASLFPGWRAYRLSLADGLTPRT